MTTDRIAYEVRRLGDDSVVAEALDTGGARCAVETLMLVDGDTGPFRVVDANAGPSSTDPVARLRGDTIVWTVTHGKGVFD